MEIVDSAFFSDTVISLWELLKEGELHSDHIVTGNLTKNKMPNTVMLFLRLYSKMFKVAFTV